MAQLKIKQMMVLIEPSIYKKIEEVTSERGLSVSAYFRKLAISDLLKSHKLTTEELLHITEG